MKIRLCGGILLGLAVAGCVTVSDPSGRVVVREETGRVAVIFSDRDRAMIRSYYGTRRLPPGLAKRSRLPPGLRKHIRRHGRLPPGLSGRALPDKLEQRLKPLPRGYLRLLVGRDVVILETDTDTVMDVLRDALP